MNTDPIINPFDQGSGAVPSSSVQSSSRSERFPPAQQLPRQFQALFVFDGQLRRMQFEAADAAEAEAHARRWGVGLDARPVDAPMSPGATPVQLEAYDAETTCRVLGNISRTTLWRWQIAGRLDRLPGTGRVLFTRVSVERLARGTKPPVHR